MLNSYIVGTWRISSKIGLFNNFIFGFFNIYTKFNLIANTKIKLFSPLISLSKKVKSPWLKFFFTTSIN